MAPQAVELHVVSDSTGETATRLVHALEAQFPEQPFEEIRHPMVESVEDLADAVRRARGRPAVVVYTLVEPEAPRRDAHALPPGAAPLLRPPRPADRGRRQGLRNRGEDAGGRSHPLDETYFRRMEAIEFAVKYDDGIAGGLDDADIVLVGVSRTSKTPLSIYLGYLGYRAANVPIVKGIEPPKELFDVDPHKIVGLKIDATSPRSARTAHDAWAGRTTGTRSCSRSTRSWTARPRCSASSGVR